jgi:hypothetical protein
LAQGYGRGVLTKNPEGKRGFAGLYPVIIEIVVASRTVRQHRFYSPSVGLSEEDSPIFLGFQPAYVAPKLTALDPYKKFC